MRLCGGVATASGGGTSGIVNLRGRGDSNLSGDIALVPGATDSIFCPGRAAAVTGLIAISCSASLMKPRSPSCSDSNIASGRSCRLKNLLSVLRMALTVFPCGMGGSVSIITPLAQCTRRPRLRELQRKRRPQRASRVRGGCFYRKVAGGVRTVIRLSASTPMPPAPLGLFIIGGSCRIQFVRLRDGRKGIFPAGDGEGYSASVEKLLLLPIGEYGTWVLPRQHSAYRKVSLAAF